MNNKIINVSEGDLDNTIELYDKEEFIVVDIDGNQIKSKNDFFEVMEKELRFPSACDGLWARFDDWITDLTWIEKNKGICIVIRNFSKLADGNTGFCNSLIEDFEKKILPYWEHEVINIVVGGTVRNFVVIVSE